MKKEKEERNLNWDKRKAGEKKLLNNTSISLAVCPNHWKHQQQWRQKLIEKKKKKNKKRTFVCFWHQIIDGVFLLNLFIWFVKKKNLFGYLADCFEIWKKKINWRIRAVMKFFRVCFVLFFFSFLLLWILIQNNNCPTVFSEFSFCCCFS